MWPSNNLTGPGPEIGALLKLVCFFPEDHVDLLKYIVHIQEFFFNI